MQISSLLGHTQEVLDIVLNSKKPADSLIDSFFRSHKYLGSHDRRFIAETVYGTLRHLRKCEYVLDFALAEIDDNVLEKNKSLLLIVAFLSIQGTMHGVTPDIITSRLASALSTDQCERILLNLSKPVSISIASVVNRLGIEYSYPDWIVQKLIDQYGEQEAENICSSLNEQAPLTLRVNTLKAKVGQCQEEFKKQGIEALKTSLSPFGLILAKRINVFSLPLFRNGWFEVQDEGSQLLPVIIDPKPNIKLLDICAGPAAKRWSLLR